MDAPYIPRLAEETVRKSLQDFRVVMIEGPRQAGKSTLARRFASEHVPIVSCGDNEIQDRIDADIGGFVASLGERAIIDEIQLRPEITMAIKEEVDSRPAMGRFLLTGSAAIKAMKHTGDSLAGRACPLTLLPLCQAEIRLSKCNGFLDYLFSARKDDALPRREAFNPDPISARGGYPEFLNLATAVQRSRWLGKYCNLIQEKDIPLIREVRTTVRLRQVLAKLARGCCSKLSVLNIARELGMQHATASNLLLLAQDVGIISMLNNFEPIKGYDSATKRPKLQFNDSGMLATLLRISEQDAQAGRIKTRDAAQLFECLVFSEIAKLCCSADEGHRLFFWADGRAEVDVVLHFEGRIAGVEVKRKRSVNRSDFKGLARLASFADNMVRGVVIHYGSQFSTFQVAGKAGPVVMQAIPASWLWDEWPA